MATAKQLPSGSWRVRVYDNDLKKQISFTSDLPGKAGKAEAELMAREYLLGKRKRKTEVKVKTIGECIDDYINSKENILSPRTVSEYRKSKINDLLPLCEKPVDDLTQTDIQKWVNTLALKKSPKTIHNAHGLLVSVLNVYAPDMRVRTTLPKIQKKIKHLPTVEDVLKAFIGSDVELPCLLAIWLGLRMSEIRGIRKEDIIDGVLTVDEVIVKVERQDVVKSQTKTYDSRRQIRLPEFLLRKVESLPDEQDHIVELSDTIIYKHFVKLIAAAGLPHMTFHDLRHLNASVMLMLGVPDKYAMERGGWSSPSIMKSVYQHTFTAERQAIDKKIDSYFESTLDSII